MWLICSEMFKHLFMSQTWVRNNDGGRVGVRFVWRSLWLQRLSVDLKARTQMFVLCLFKRFSLINRSELRVWSDLSLGMFLCHFLDEESVKHISSNDRCWDHYHICSCSFTADQTFLFSYVKVSNRHQQTVTCFSLQQPVIKVNTWTWRESLHAESNAMEAEDEVRTRSRGNERRQGHLSERGSGEEWWGAARGSEGRPGAVRRASC